MSAFTIMARMLLTVTALVTLLGPASLDPVAGAPGLEPPEAEVSEPDVRDHRLRPNRRQRRATGHLGTIRPSAATGPPDDDRSPRAVTGHTRLA